MEDIQLDGSNGNIKSSQKQFLDPKPVPSGSSGVGLPYAPEDWPHPGDKWFWKVGSRKYASGHFIDRFIRPPKHLPRASGSSRPWIHSKLSLKQYLQKEFPQTDVNAIFDSFIWKIPAESTIKVKLGHSRSCPESLEANKCLVPVSLEVNKCPASEVAINAGGCKAGNKMCIRMRNLDYRSEHKACDICCTEDGFCLDCCCILCCTTVDSVHQSYNFIRCQAVQEGSSLTCGHVAHLDCALRAYMAGTVGGSIDLDAEYYCRCCDKKTDLIPHVAKIIETCESLGSLDDVEKMLTLGFCILHGSEKMRANNLRDRIGAVMVKLNCGVSLGEIWKVENDISTISAGQANSITMSSPPTNGRNHIVPDSTIEVEHSSSLGHMPHGERKETLYITSNHIDKSAKLEDDVDQALRGLKRSQESEYRTAEEKLYGQKDLLLGLYQQLEVERAELARPMPSEGSRGDALLTSVLARVDQIKREEMKLKQMMRIAEGFGLAPRTLLKEYFSMPLDD